MNKLFLLFIGAALFPTIAIAAEQPVVINEIAWMGTTASASDEWLELRNTTDSTISLAGWKLQSADGKIQINLTGVIKSRGYYLLERTDNESVPNVAANLIYKGALNNAGGHLLLYDTGHKLVDEVNFPNHWPAGNSTTKQTMEKTATDWQTSAKPNGTPGSENTIGTIKNPSTPKPSIASTTSLPKTGKSGNSDNVSAAALLPQQIPSRKSNPWILFIVALAITITSAITILILKLFILKKYVRS